MCNIVLGPVRLQVTGNPTQLASSIKEAYWPGVWVGFRAG